MQVRLNVVVVQTDGHRKEVNEQSRYRVQVVEVVVAFVCSSVEKRSETAQCSMQLTIRRTIQATRQ